MSRYPPPEYRGPPPRDRSRSPSRFPDRRPSAATIFDNRPGPPPRAGSDAPRGPRSQFDGPRPAPIGRLESASGPRPQYTSLRDAPPLGSGERGRPYRERDYDRRDRPPSRSPVRGMKDARDFAPRDVDIARRRESRDGPLSTASTYSDAQPPPSTQFRGGFGRGRGRGDFPFRGGRGGRGNVDDRELFRRDRAERSPPRWDPRDRSRDEREPEPRDDRRFGRGEDERRPSDWSDRERDRDIDRFRRDQPAPRPDGRISNESIGSATTKFQSSHAPIINPERLALIEASGADPAVRRPSLHLEQPPVREVRREPPETPAYLNGRAETAAKRYEARDSSPPTQAPAVPAFSFLPPSAKSALSVPIPQARQPQEQKPVSPAENIQQPESRFAEPSKPAPPVHAPVAPKAQLGSPPPAAPRAPRAHDADDVFISTSRLQGSRSLEGLSTRDVTASGLAGSRLDVNTAPTRPLSHSPMASSSLPMLIQPVSPRQPSRISDFGPPTGPRASRVSPRLMSVSPRPPFTSPRSDAGIIPGAPSGPRVQTPPPSAPSGPRSQAFSVSPKTAPTAPKAIRAPPLAPRGPDRGTAAAPARPFDKPNTAQMWTAPSAPRNQQWNQWRAPGAPGPDARSVPAKRDFAGEEKRGPGYPLSSSAERDALRVKTEDDRLALDDSSVPSNPPSGDSMNIDRQPPRRQTSLISGHSAAQSFFGKPAAGKEEDENDDTGVSDIGQDLPATSSEDESELEVENLSLFHAKFQRRKRQLEAQLADLSARQYRATTPLESIARLARISAQDLQRVMEQREHEMELDDSPVTNQNLPETTHSSESGEASDVHTPRGDTLHRINIRGSDDSLENIRHIRRPSPEPVSLPYLVKDGRLSFHDSEAFRDGHKRHQDIEEEVLDAMEEEFVNQDDVDRNVEDAFAEDYRLWRENCEDLDRDREKQEELERQKSIEPGPELDAPMAPPMNPFEGGRRLHKFSSEYDVEQVIKQSEETARIERERQDRETRKNQADMEKEARIPDQMPEEDAWKGVFVDTNRYRDADALTLVFSYEPPVDDFTENEQQIFIAAFKETPKKWGEIASLLPGRTYQDCIGHYYAHKWDGRFRDNRTKKLKAGGRRGRGGARGPRGRMGGLMADLARVEDFLSPENMSEKGRPRRAAAPTTFAEKEAEAKASLLGPSPAKKPGPMSKGDGNGDTGSDKPGKRQKRNGDKPGGKRGKNAQPLQNLVAAPQGTFGKEFIQSMGPKADLGRAQKLEEAGLLANFHAGQPGVGNADTQAFYTHDGYMHPLAGADDADRSKFGAQGSSTKQSASSYWSVPEQQDFVKYIGHFGRDFAAIASHMGTKTQTMIKNHFQRQIDSGSRPELEEAANRADERRVRGEDIGAPPAPTPIIKRKYEPPQTATSRPLAPNSEAMEVDEHVPAVRAQPKHASPPQFQARPQYTAPSQHTPIPATRVVPSPMAVAAVPAPTQSQVPRPLQYPFGGRPPFQADSRPESRQGIPAVSAFRAVPEPQLRGQQSQSGRPQVDAQDREYLQKLAEEQERALRIQALDATLQRQGSQQRHPMQGSPLDQPLHHPADRKPLGEERSSPPPRNVFTGFPRPSLGSSTFGQLGGPPPFTTFAGRSPFDPSPTKKEEPRPGSVPTGLISRGPAPTPQPAPPKRSDVMSLLNRDDDEPKPPKRDSLPSAPQRIASPAPQPFSHTPSASSIPGIRREPSFGQTSVPQSPFHRNHFGGSQGSAQSSAGSALKHEPTHAPASQPPKQDWAAAARALQTSQPPSTNPILERDVRSYYPHSHRSSILGSLNQPRGIPSPPPLGSGIGHSRTPSLTGATSQATRDQPRSGLAGPLSSASYPSAQSLQSNPYASQPSTPFPQPQTSQAQNQTHHAHNSSLGGPFPSLHHRTISQDHIIRQEQAHHAAMRERERERDERDMQWRREALEAENRRREEAMYRQRQQEQERQHQPPSSAIQPPSFPGPPFSQTRGLDLREQARRDTAAAMQREDQERHRAEDERRRHEAMVREREQIEDNRRREDLFRRLTPSNGAFGFPPPRPR